MTPRTTSLLLVSIAIVFPLFGQQPIPATSEQIVVSATKLPENEIDLPADTTIITGAELRARGAQTLSDALATAEGVEAFDGSDQGSGLPNVALWGLKEFDAYLVEMDGVPMGGTFDPDLQQIDVRNIDRIEIVRGPSGVVHGSTAFAGVISVYTSGATATRAEVAAGIFGRKEGRVSTGGTRGDNRWGVSASATGDDGWRPRTGGHRNELDLSWNSSRWMGGSMKLHAFGIERKEDFGAPLPVDSDTGVMPEGVGFNSNLALRGAQIGTRDFGLSTRFDRPLAAGMVITNVFGYTHRNRRLAQTFVDMVDGDDAEGAGTDFRPRHDDVFEDLRLEWTIPQHHVLAGISASYGSLNSSGRRFDLAYNLAEPVPSIDDITDATGIRVTDRRMFAGVYVEDEWTPFARLTTPGGLRYDRVGELRSFESTEDEGISRSSRNDGAVSGRLGAVYRLLDAPSTMLDAANVHVALNRTFKPAAFDPAPQEDEGLLAPERSRSFEAGIKVAGNARRWELDATAFNMHLTNLVVSADVGGNPTRINAGELQFRGVEFAGALHPWQSLALRAGLALHDPKFVHFSAVTEEGQVESADGNIPELVAKRTWQLAAVYSPEHFVGGSVTVRGVGRRALDRDNVFFTKPYTTVDASVYVPVSRARFEIVGRNLTNRRFFTTDSELQDGLRYISAPRSVIGRVSWTF
jgi:iron complex outermembrane receptor protein